MKLPEILAAKITHANNGTRSERNILQATNVILNANLNTIQSMEKVCCFCCCCLFFSLKVMGQNRNVKQTQNTEVLSASPCDFPEIDGLTLFLFCPIFYRGQRPYKSGLHFKHIQNLSVSIHFSSQTSPQILAILSAVYNINILKVCVLQS